MADRTIHVDLKANVSDFRRQMGAARDSLGDLEKRAGGAEKAAGTAMGKIAQSARLQADSWDAVGGSLIKAGAATTALSAIVLKTGVSYNQLQQQSRAALSTMLGGAEAANAQMDKLDAFARTSPFAKDVFIKAQQQMIGFGIATEKVVPYLSAINEAVAATGGSNQDIAELTRIFSQVQAAAKITATDLMQFGQRGVDAATLIGSQMGKTGAEIRAEITAGTIDAGQALDALAAGMQETYGGASAAVKDTFSGAIDSVKAAFRDLASTLATPLVDPNGGGFLVDMTNGLADFLRVVEAAPGPLQEIIFYGSAVQGVLMLITGAIAKGVPALHNYWENLTNLASTFPKLATAAKVGTVAIGAIGVALAAVTLGMGMYAKAQAEADARITSLADTLDVQTGALTANSSAWVQNELERKRSFGMGNSDSMIGAATEMGISIETLTQAYLGNADAIAEAKDAATAWAEANPDMFLSSITQAEQFNAKLDEQQVVIADAQAALERKTAVDGAATDELGLLTDATGEFAGATADATDELEAARKALEAQIDALEALRDHAMSAARSEVALEESLVGLSKALTDNGATLDLNTERGRDNRKAVLDAVDAANKHAEALLDQGAGADAASSSLSTARQRIIEAGQAAGISEDEMSAYIDTLFMTPSEIATRIALDTDPAIRKLDSFLSLYSNREVPIRIVAEDHATARARSIAANISNFSATVRVYGQAFQATGGPVGPLAEVVRRVQYRAGGGRVTGPGGPTDDLVPARGPNNTRFQLSNDEWIINAYSSRKYGDAAMAAVNAGTAEIKYRASGGPAEPSRFYVPAVGAGGRGGSQGGSFSVEGARITGTLDIGGALVDLVDGRLSFAAASVAAEGRAV